MLLKKGETGISVTYLQYGLHIMCCSPNGFDGNFGAGTENAVIKYQEKVGLTADGVVGDGTWNNFVGEISVIQRALAAKGYYASSIDGVAGPGTYNAVVAFQQANGLDTDGQVGSATRVKLMRAGAEEVTSDDFPLSKGASGDKVLYLQYGLHILCCTPNGVDGTFGAGTETAVKNFQSKYSMTVDGVATVALWNKMKTLITEIQQALLNKGYNVGVVDGVAGESTYSQVVAFQNANGLIADGQVGPSTKAALTGAAASGDATDNFPLQVGSRGPYVLFLQYGLHINCINVNGADGVFGAGTKTAVETFQTKNNMEVTGIATTEVWEKLRSIIKPIQQALTNQGYDTGGVDGVAGAKTYDAVIQFQTDKGLGADGMVGSGTMAVLLGESSGGGTVSSVLRTGSSGSLTKYLQRILVALGYSVTVDGIFGTTTHEAVVAFQNAYGLDADGIVGGGTWSKLFSVYSVNASGTGVNKMVNVAQHELNWGFAEDNGNNITPYGEWYGMNNAAWCAMFVSWCAHQAGILGTVVPRFAYCPYGVSWYREQGRFYSRSGGYVPKIGDTIFFFSSTTNEVCHTGIVTGVTETTVRTIEGNSSDRVKEHVYDRTNTYIHGYGSNGGTASIDPEEVTDAEINAAYRKKWIDLMAALGKNATPLELVYDKKVEIPSAIPNVRHYYQFSGGVRLFDNSNSIATLTVGGGEMVYATELPIWEDLEDSVSTEIAADVKTMGMKLSFAAGTSNCKANVEISTDGTKYEISYTIKGNIQVNELVSVPFSFGYYVEVTPDTPTGTAPVTEQVKEFEVSYEEAWAMGSTVVLCLLLIAVAGSAIVGISTASGVGAMLIGTLV